MKIKLFATHNRAQLEEEVNTFLRFNKYRKIQYDVSLNGTINCYSVLIEYEEKPEPVKPVQPVKTEAAKFSSGLWTNFIISGNSLGNPEKEKPTIPGVTKK